MSDDIMYVVCTIYTFLYWKDFFWHDILWLKLFFLLCLQHSEEMYDPEIYRHQISEYYNPYVLDADIQAGESNFNIVLCLMGTLCELKVPPALLTYFTSRLKTF